MPLSERRKIAKGWGAKGVIGSQQNINFTCFLNFPNTAQLTLQLSTSVWAFILIMILQLYHKICVFSTEGVWKYSVYMFIIVGLPWSCKVLRIHCNSSVPRWGPELEFLSRVSSTGVILATPECFTLCYSYRDHTYFSSFMQVQLTHKNCHLYDIKLDVLIYISIVK